ncbi:hypothetical protein EKO23_16305 [Nocardioides guangzhouensis]|uniref:Uncharacterized protein n=1 Tax=Nocardioides guangzhouensis TaxID=2497878 RepID=A0A4Q4Z8S9_9ACTN|nr:hypothetical protein [Nocardioides guangzhouensis]RYP84222.1 hypothetical protein EKO23_16305 [Nocardioides guangzhouensis]
MDAIAVKDQGRCRLSFQRIHAVIEVVQTDRHELEPAGAPDYSQWAFNKKLVHNVAGELYSDEIAVTGEDPADAEGASKWDMSGYYDDPDPDEAAPQDSASGDGREGGRAGGGTSRQARLAQPQAPAKREIALPSDKSCRDSTFGAAS